MFVARWEHREKIKENAFELVDIGIENLWRHYMGVVVGACDEVFGMRSRTRKGDTWWWNDEVEAMSRKMNIGHCLEIVLNKMRTGIKARR